MIPLSASRRWNCSLVYCDPWSEWWISASALPRRQAASFVFSNEGFALWSKPSTPALRTGRFIRTKNAMFELPSASIARSRLGTTPAVRSADQPSDVWFDEPVFETSLRADRLDLEIMLIQFDRFVEPLQEGKESDLVDRMNAPVGR